MKIKEKIIVPPLINCAVEPLAYGFTHCLKTFDFREKLTNLFIPTLILCGAEDWITPVDQSKILHDLIPNSRLVVCPEAGHSIALDVPDIYRREILTFLKNI